MHPRDLPLTEARALIDRAIDKAEQLGLRGGLAVVGASGGLISASRMDAGGPGGMARARSKAWISATQQIPSAEHLRRMTTIAPPVATGFAQASPEAVFPGAGGLPIRKDGVVVAGIAASGATVSPFFPEGVAPEVVSASGRPANPEDLLIAYALGVPYVGQHGDDGERWQARFGDLTVSPEDSLGMAPAPRASHQAELAWARRLCDAAVEEATRRGLRIAVAVVDPGGDPIQQDRMDDAPTGAVAVAQAIANSAALLGHPSELVGELYDVAALAATLFPPILATAGGVPLVADGRIVGGVGVAGPRPGVCADIADLVAGIP